MVELVKKMLADQFAATLAMFNDCVEKCPSEHWDGIIGKYPFWQVAYHTLCYAELYLTARETEFALRADLHPAGWKEFEDEYPSRKFEQAELLRYVQIVREKLTRSIAAETSESLQGESGHTRRKFSRVEMYIYNMRHIQHHTGQLSAFLRKVGAEPRWFGSGWPQ